MILADKFSPCSEVYSSGVYSHQQTIYFVPDFPFLYSTISSMTCSSSSNSGLVSTCESGITEGKFLLTPVVGVATSDKEVRCFSLVMHWLKQLKDFVLVWHGDSVTALLLPSKATVYDFRNPINTYEDSEAICLLTTVSVMDFNEYMPVVWWNNPLLASNNVPLLLFAQYRRADLSRRILAVFISKADGQLEYSHQRPPRREISRCDESSSWPSPWKWTASQLPSLAHFWIVASFQLNRSLDLVWNSFLNTGRHFSSTNAGWTTIQPQVERLRSRRLVYLRIVGIG